MMPLRRPAYRWEARSTRSRRADPLERSASTPTRPTPPMLRGASIWA